MIQYTVSKELKVQAWDFSADPWISVDFENRGGGGGIFFFFFSFFYHRKFDSRMH